MPAPISNTFVSLSTIEGVDCIGDSRTIINENITALGVALSTLNNTSNLQKFATNIGNGSLTAFTVTHNLGTRDVITSVYDDTTYENIITSVANTTTNTVSLSFNTAPGTNAYRVVVIG